jgi:hypothetical protein
MKRASLLVFAVALTPLVLKAQQPDLKVVTADAQVVEVKNDSLTIQPRKDGKFEKAIVLKVTGTSTFTLVGTRDNPGKAPVVVQTKKDAKDLKPKQTVTVVYTMIGDDKVLLSAVWQDRDK